MLFIKYNFFKYKMSKFYRKEGILFMKDSRKKDILKKFLEKRIKDNKKLFIDEELKIIKENFNIIKKIYILGMKDITDIKENKK